MKRDVLVCSMLAFVALTCIDVKGMVRGQDLTLDNSLEQARMYWNEIARLGGNPEEIMGIYRQGVYFDSLLPAFRETIEEAFRTITQLREQNRNRDNQRRQNFPQAPRHDRAQRPNVQNDIALRNVQEPNVQNDTEYTTFCSGYVWKFYASCTSKRTAGKSVLQYTVRS